MYQQDFKTIHKWIIPRNTSKCKIKELKILVTPTTLKSRAASQTPHFKPRTKHRSSYELPQLLGKKKSMAMTSTSCCTSCARSSKQISNSKSSLRSKLWSHVFHKGQEEMDEAGGNRKKQPLMTNVQLYNYAGFRRNHSNSWALLIPLFDVWRVRIA